MWVILILALLILPDVIPAHWSGSSEPTRYGSKYELMIIPFLFSLLALGLNALATVIKGEKYGNGKPSDLLLVNTNLVICALVNVAFLCFVIYLFLFTH